MSNNQIAKLFGLLPQFYHGYTMVSVAKPWLICSYHGLTILTMVVFLILSVVKLWLLFCKGFLKDLRLKDSIFFCKHKLKALLEALCFGNLSSW